MNTKFKLGRLLGICLTLAALIALPARAALNQWTVLGTAERATYGFSHSLTLDATNCTANVTNAANGTYNTIFPTVNDGSVTFPAGLRVNRVGLYLDKAYATSDGGASVAFNLGDSTVTNRFISAAAIGTNAGTGVLETNLSNGLIGYNAGKWIMVDKGTNHIYTTGTNLTFHILGPSLNSTLSSGRLRLFINAVDLNGLRTK